MNKMIHAHHMGKKNLPLVKPDVFCLLALGCALIAAQPLKAAPKYRDGELIVRLKSESRSSMAVYQDALAQVGAQDQGPLLNAPFLRKVKLADGVKVED